MATRTAKPASLASELVLCEQRLADVEDRPERRRAPDARGALATPPSEPPHEPIPCLAHKGRTRPPGLVSRQEPRRSGGGPAATRTRERNRVRHKNRSRGHLQACTAAAIAGPAIKPKSAIAPNSDVAAGSRRSSTRLGSAARRPVETAPVPTPARRAKQNVREQSRRPARGQGTQRPERHPPATTQARRDQRSATAPNSGPSNIAGTTSASRTSPIAHGESNRSSATSSSAT